MTALRRSAAAVLLLLPALTGCILHKRAPVPIAAVAPPPPPPPQPLYLAEMNQDTPALPDLPVAAPPAAQPAPPPKSVVLVAEAPAKRPLHAKHGRERRSEEEREARDREEARDHEETSPAGEEVNAAPSAPSADSTAKVTTQTPAGDTAQPTPIGQITAGPAEDTSVDRRQAADLIQTTQRGVNSLHQNLSGDQIKTVLQIRSFLIQAQRALHNGDLDGAFTLATKAKVLLDELTGS